MKENGCFYFYFFYFCLFLFFFLTFNLKVTGFSSYYFKYNNILANKYIFLLNF